MQLIDISKMEPAGVGKLIVEFLETAGYGCTQAELDAKILRTRPHMAGEIDQVCVVLIFCFCFGVVYVCVKLLYVDNNLINY